MSKATELADNFEECPLNYLGEVAPMLRAQDEAIKLALEWIEAQPEPRMIGAAKVLAKLREVQG